MQPVVLVVALFATTVSGQFVSHTKLSAQAADYAIKNTQLAQNNPAVCLTGQLKRCNSIFDDRLGFNTTLDWTNSFDLSDAIDAYADAGIENILALCDARAVFYQCLGAQYASCVSLYNLLNDDDATPASAYNYVQTWHSLDFLCNAGFEEALNQFQCMKYIPKGSDDYDNCLSTFSYELNQDPTQFCQSVDRTAQCLNGAYAKGCSTTDPRGAGWFGCENFRQSFEETCWETTRCYVH